MSTSHCSALTLPPPDTLPPEFTRSSFGDSNTCAPKQQSSKTSREANPVAWTRIKSEEAAPEIPTADSVGFESARSSWDIVRKTIRMRLYELLKYSAEDGEPPPSTSSIVALNSFLEQNQKVSMPLLATDSVGHLVATWRLGQISMLSLKFIEGRKVEFAWAYEARRKTTRDWGTANWDEFIASFPHAPVFLGCGS